MQYVHLGFPYPELLRDAVTFSRILSLNQMHEHELRDCLCHYVMFCYKLKKFLMNFSHNALLKFWDCTCIWNLHFLLAWRQLKVNKNYITFTPTCFVVLVKIEFQLFYCLGFQLGCYSSDLFLSILVLYQFTFLLTMIFLKCFLLKL